MAAALNSQAINQSLGAVPVRAVLMFVVTAAMVFACRLKPDQRLHLMAGSIGEPLVCWLGMALEVEALNLDHVWH